MKAIIDGKRYNTETALQIGDAIGPNGLGSGDFKNWEQRLYRTKGGAYFLAGEGGAMSPFAESYGENGSQGGARIDVIDEAAALRWLEQAGQADAIEQHFPDQVQDA